jgi:starvation-inducible DNA-binding protein
MVALLVEGHETVIKTIRSIYGLVGTASDQASEDMLTQRLNVHEKNAWMLRSLLEK